ncbi:hypothetical protein DFP74_1721 [Nocardiopsis sp. Huas11]|uniref:hypothetical protein n=1 Tax=Nocardiopsis sp. Huas11 TaxID=2183912 RepID=UPI000F234A93|nr:hypothetical protein [Nocardiopsis sp. Huas11]RKS06098.1 hypothetical protein DFP74_1721 [Nocardiopsis sp. Huas11]
MLRSAWTPGPAADVTGPVLLAVTAFHADRWYDLPGIHRSGRALGRAWPRLGGAVGMWLWTEPRRRACGSVSVWRNEPALRGFVASPDHVTIMLRYRGRGRLTSSAWWTDQGRPADLWAQARPYLPDGEGPR